jgi:hypothetical protein
LEFFAWFLVPGSFCCRLTKRNGWEEELPDQGGLSAGRRATEFASDSEPDLCCHVLSSDILSDAVQLANNLASQAVRLARKRKSIAVSARWLQGPFQFYRAGWPVDGVIHA